MTVPNGREGSIPIAALPGNGGFIRQEDRFPLGALAILLVVTALWWAFALWPLPTETPEWIQRARFVCFNTTDSGLPDRSGWILLVGQPLGMFGLLFAGWGARALTALRHLSASQPGRILATAVPLLLVGGLVAAGARIRAADLPGPLLPDAGTIPDSYPRLDRAWPETPGLVDQRGEEFSPAALGGRPAFVTFAFAHCGTICPLVVHNTVEARNQVASEEGVELSVVVLTLDPWRDTPSRLPAMASDWMLSEADFALSGEIDQVEAALDAWGIARVRDPSTGDVTHPPLVYLVEPDGTLAYASTGARAQLVELARRIEG